MRGAYRPANPGLGFSILDIPILGSAVSWADEKVKALVKSIIQKYAEFEQAALDAPKAVADAQRIVSVLQVTGGTPQQMQEAQAYLEAARKMQSDASRRGPVDSVVKWVSSLTQQQQKGMGAVVLAAPLWVAGTAAVAIAVIASMLKNRDNAKTIRSALQAGFTPEQIAKLGVGDSPFKMSLFGATSAVTIGVVAFGAFLVWKAMRR